jgi:hypothetical protein
VIDSDEIKEIIKRNDIEAIKLLLDKGLDPLAEMEPLLTYIMSR